MKNINLLNLKNVPILAYIVRKKEISKYKFYPKGVLFVFNIVPNFSNSLNPHESCADNFSV